MSVGSTRRILPIALLIISILWCALTFLPLLYSVLFQKPDDLKTIVRALEGRTATGVPVPSVVERTTASAGLLRRGVQIGYYSGITAHVQLGASHTLKHTQVAYIAWFQKMPKPIILLISRDESGGATTYGVDEGEPIGFVRGYTLPLLLLGLSIYLMRRRTLLKQSQAAQRAHSGGV